jgi:hypothetical protein
MFRHLPANFRDSIKTKKHKANMPITYTEADVCIHAPDNINNYELVREEAHYQLLWYQSMVDFCLSTLCILEF